MKLKYKFITIFIFVSLVPLVIATLVYLNSSEKIITNILKEQLKANLETFNELVNSKVNIFATEIIPLTEFDVFRKTKKLNESEFVNECKLAVGNYYLNQIEYISSITIFDYRNKKSYTCDKIVVQEGGVSPFIRVEEIDIKVKNLSDFDNVRIEGKIKGTSGYIIDITRLLRDEEQEIWGEFLIELKFEKILKVISEEKGGKYRQYFSVFDKFRSNIFTSSIPDINTSEIITPEFIDSIPQVFSADGNEIRISDRLFYGISLKDELLNLDYYTVLILDQYKFEIRRSAFIYITLILVLAGILIIGILVISARISNRIDRVKTAAEKISHGEFKTRIKTDVNDEIAKLSNSINKMAEDIEKYIENIRKMSKEVAEKEKLDELNQLKSRFLSMTSHELKTPLTTIKWTADNLVKGIYGEIPIEQKEHLNNIMRTIDHLVRIVENLLDLSRIESGVIALNINKNNLDSIIDEAIYFTRSSAENRKIRVVKDVETEEPLLLDCDRDKMVDIIRNIVDNAIKFSPENSEVLVKSYKNDNKNIHISIIDKGIGIEKEEVYSIFTPFYKIQKAGHKAKGLGLGLSIVKTLVDYHGGRISVESDIGKGTKFNLIFPINNTGKNEKQTIDNRR